MNHTRRPLLALPIALGGCGSGVFARRVAVRRVAIAVAPAANNNSPIALDLVHVSDRPPLAGALGGISAAEWFEKRAQYQRDWPRDLVVRSWEVVPGQVLPEERLPSPAVSHEALVFALYATPGVHRARLAQGGSLAIRLGEEEMEVTER